MAEGIERMDHYHMDEQEDLKFIIDNYTRARPFSSFFSGIAGLMGVPMWCFYVNRGQAVCSFGTESKDGAIMEFQPANKAYRLVSTHGFRTFLKYSRGSQEGFYEPFSESQANLQFKLQNKMMISPWDLCLEERNETLGILVRISYFTIPEEPIAGLARTVTITNLRPDGLHLELLDGIPVITPYGMWDQYMKNMSRTIEAWSIVENLDRKVPFYRLKVNAEDRTEVTQIEAGNFYAGFCTDESGSKMLDTIIDPALIFGHMNDMTYPFAFCKKGFHIAEEQNSMNRTLCAMGHADLELDGKESKTVYSIIGHAKSLEILNGLIAGYLKGSFFISKALRNKEIIRKIMDGAFVNSSSREFNSYSRQNFLDNILRGGLPISMEANGKRDVLYAYSRRHGDPERDYNSFKLMPSYYSQGNGAYRDINQNRRNDAWFNPDVGESNIDYFLNLIQLDGYNPLIVNGVRYQLVEELEDHFLTSLVEESAAERLAEFLRRPFHPHTLLTFVNDEKLVLKVPAHELISTMILHSRKLEEAEHGEGYWCDHWHYNLDLLDSYEALYPDGMAALLADEKRFSFYEDEYCVVPRKERIVFTNGRPRQLNCVKKDKRKMQLLMLREGDRNKVRTGDGEGEIFQTSLWTKLLCICVNKLASLDANGTGVEMEAGKPSWNDAMNGLPSLFGSCASETFELKRLILLLQGWLIKYGLNNMSIKIPVELDQFIMGMAEVLSREADHFSSAYCKEYWEEANHLKEGFRESIKYGIVGNMRSVDAAYIDRFLRAALSQVEIGIRKAYDPALGIYHTYFINEPVEFEILAGEEENSSVVVKKFRQIPLPPFLEGQVHALRVELDGVRAKKLYDSILQTELYDNELGMYKTNASLKDFPIELGRLRAFSPGWLENESIFLHMEYKYLLELLKAGLVDEFYKAAETAFVPFMKPEVYGRSIFENSSFIASSVNPDKTVRGCGFVARLSGTTAEFYNMLLVMATGIRPFCLNTLGELELKLIPSLPGWIFTRDSTKAEIWQNGSVKKIILESNTYSFMFLGGVLLIYHNEKRLDTYGKMSAKIQKMILEQPGGSRMEFAGDTIPAPYAADIRRGLYSRITGYLDSE